MPKPPAKGTESHLDAVLWAHVIQAVTPLRGRRKPEIPQPMPAVMPPIMPISPVLAPAQPKQPMMPLTIAETPQPGLEKNRYRNLKKGEVRIDARIDLHGMTRFDAEDRFVRFMQQQAAIGSRHVLVITGKGHAPDGGVLRQSLQHWVNRVDLRPLILAVHPAHRSHGGGGAFYILLRKLSL